MVPGAITVPGVIYGDKGLFTTEAVQEVPVITLLAPAVSMYKAVAPPAMVPGAITVPGVIYGDKGLFTTEAVQEVPVITILVPKQAI